jgi:hypothetical protein
MSCGHAEQLDAVAAGEAPRALEVEVEAHVRGCAFCRQELQWLRTERALFRLRAGRDEVSHLWEGVAQPGQLAAGRPWLRVLGGLAAGLLVVVGAVSFARWSGGPPSASPPTLVASEPGMSEDPVSFPLDPELCSRLPVGVGFHCAPMPLASIIASR